jgi:plasmid stabilization system protein ParE
MRRRLRIEPEARAELAEAQDWYEKQHPGLGDELLIAVNETLSRVLDEVDTSTPVPDVDVSLPARRVFVPRFPYSVVFLRMSEEVRILAIAHQSRRPGYWRDRG